MPAAAPSRTRSGVPLWVLLQDPTAGTELARVPVLWPDLADCVSEFWMETFLRAGHPDAVLDTSDLRVVPLADPSDAAFALTGTGPSGQTSTVPFITDALRSIAIRTTAGLTASGRLPKDLRVVFSLLQEATPPESVASDIRPVPEPLHAHRLSFAALLAGAEAVNEDSSHDTRFHVIYTRTARKQAEDFSRRGAHASPPVETGCVLIGVLCVDTDTEDLFVVVLEALEARHTECSTDSLAFTARSWHGIRAILRARQQQPATRAHRLVGQAHGHPFMPNPNGDVCLACRLRDVCDLTSAFLSDQDRSFMRAMFAGRAPWQIAHTFGLNARGEATDALFSLRQGFHQRRGYFVLHDLLDGSVAAQLGLPSTA